MLCCMGIEELSPGLPCMCWPMAFTASWRDGIPAEGDKTSSIMNSPETGAGHAGDAEQC